MVAVDEPVKKKIPDGSHLDDRLVLINYAEPKLWVSVSLFQTQFGARNTEYHLSGHLKSVHNKST